MRLHSVRRESVLQYIKRAGDILCGNRRLILIGLQISKCSIWLPSLGEYGEWLRTGPRQE